MTKFFNHLSGAALAGLLSLALAPAAQAQRGFHGGVHVGGGFGGGFHGGVSLGLRGGTTLANRGGYQGGYYGGHYFYGYPSIGFRLNVLPFGYFPFYWGPSLYYYYGGVFYAPMDGGGYEVTTPPVGAAVPSLPKGAQPIAIDGKQYYEFNGVYYEQTTDDQGKTIFVVAGKDGVLNTNDQDVNNPPQQPQVGDMVNQLPDGCRKIKLNGKKYYVSPDGIYYEEFRDDRGYKGYRIVSISSDDDQQQQ